MKQAILRGFDYLARNLNDQLRFCNPLLSFGGGEQTKIFLARTLNWSHEPNDQHRSLILVEEDQLGTFATVDSDLRGPIRPGQGVVLMGHQFAAAISNAGIELEVSKQVRFRQPSPAPYRFAVTDVATYESYANQLVNQAKKAFDEECNARSSNTISKRGEAALFILHNCGFARSTDVALRQLTATLIFSEPDNYRRLLIKYSIELDETEDAIHDRVMRHIDIGAFRREMQHVSFPADLPGLSLVPQASQQWIQLGRGQGTANRVSFLWPKSDAKFRADQAPIIRKLFAPFQAKDDGVNEQSNNFVSFALDLSLSNSLTSPESNPLFDLLSSEILSEPSSPTQRKEMYQERSALFTEKNSWIGKFSGLIHTEVASKKDLGYSVVATRQNVTSPEFVVSNPTRQRMGLQKYAHSGWPRQ